jgi:hypothetical protein
MDLAASSRCKVKLLLNEEESESLAKAVRGSGTPNRSLLILESIQAKLHSPTQPGLQRKRTKTLYFWLPTELMGEVRRLASELRVSQQNLIRYFLFTYLSQLERRTAPPTKPREPTLGEEVAVDA